MTKRLFGSIFVASALALLLLAVSLIFSSASTQAGHPTSGVNSGQAAAQSTKVVKIKSVAGTWADIAPFPTITLSPTPGSFPLRLKRAGAAAYSPNGKLYVLGGRHGIDGEDTTLRSIYEHTPGNPGTWLQKTALLDGSAVGSRYTANMSVAELIDSNGPEIYAIGGNSIDSAITNTVRIYNPPVDTISLLTSDPWPATPLRIPGGWAVLNNKLYIFGGFSAIGAGSVFTETWQFDPLAPAGSKWTQKANLNLGRGFIAGAALDGQIYAIGGDTWNGSTLVPVSNVERYNPVANTWTNVTSLPTARGDLGAWAYDSTTNYEISGRIAVAGGVYPTPDALGYLYNPGTNSWSSFPSMVHATRNYGYAQLNGYLYAFGGYNYANGFPDGANFNQRYDATTPLGTATSTPTGTLPTATRTSTALLATVTPIATATPCGSTANYTIATAAGTIVPGITDIGNHCDDCGTDISLPFPVTIYGQTYTSAVADSNGKLHFPADATNYTNECLPSAAVTSITLFPYWDDLYTVNSGYGIYTSVSGTAPNRIFNIEWRAQYFPGNGSANFEVRLYENSPVQEFDIVYGAITGGNTGATGGVQNAAGTRFTQDFCNGAGGQATGVKMYTLPPCASVTPVTATTTRTATVAATIPATATRTSTAAPPSPTSGCTPMNMQVNIQGFAFVPQSITIPAGSTVQWTNLDSTPHTSTSTGNWNSGTLNQNQSFSHTFDTAGTFQYACSFHPNMTGTVNVIVPCTPTVTVTTAPPTATVGCGVTTAQVNIDSFAFQPQNVTIAVGSTVRWTNLDPGPHDTTSDTGAWASGDLAQNQSFSYTFNNPGTYPYTCVRHPFMTGQVVVVAACTPTVTSTTVPPTRTNTVVPVPTTCTLQFSDVPSTDIFYPYIHCLVCRGIISGYSDGTFRPNNQVTRGQLAKMVSNSAGFNEAITGQTFQDVPSSNPFYIWIERLTRRGYMSGYVCGGQGEPCVNNRPYFRPFANATRAQISKIVANAAGYTENHTTQTFQDVPTSNEFYQFIERLASRGVISGYACGGPGEPCVNNRPYFRPFTDATRAQVAKIVASTFFPNCQTP